MTKVEDVVTDPNYDSAASGASKATIFVFVATFGYLLFFSGTSPGIFGGAGFFFIGIFVVSFVISMPLFLLRAKAPRLGTLVSVADIAITILLTRFVYLFLFAAQPSVAAEPFVVACREPIPEFTLGADSKPSNTEVARLCACIWDKLGGWEKNTARAFSQGRRADVSALNQRAFPARFGDAVTACGGRDL